MRKKCLSTHPDWAFACPKSVGNPAPNGWDVAGAAGPKMASLPAETARVSIDPGGGSMNNDSSTNKDAMRSRHALTSQEASRSRGDSTNAKRSALPKVAEGTPVALCCLTEIVDQPLEWVVDGVIPRGELTRTTGEAGVGKSGFLAGLIANLTRGQPGPRDTLRPENAENADERPHSEEGNDTDCDDDFDTDFDDDFGFEDEENDEDEDEDEHEDNDDEHDTR